MPIQGKFYQQQELVQILSISKQAISNIASRQGWQGPQPGLYWSGCVEPYLIKRQIDVEKLVVITNLKTG